MDLFKNLYKQIKWRIDTFVSISRVKLEHYLVKTGVCKDSLVTYERGFKEGYEAGCEDTEKQIRRKGHVRFK